MLTDITCKAAAPYGELDPFQRANIFKAITACWQQKGSDMTFGDVAREIGVIASDTKDRRLTDLGVMLEPYHGNGAFAKFFDRPSNIDFTNQFVVIEFESLKRQPTLHRLALMSLLFRITSEMYLTRDRRKLFLIDELKQQLGSESDNTLIHIIEEAARRARKYGGALGTATQMIDDYYASDALLTAFNLSDALFIMRQRKESIELLAQSKKLSMDEGKMRRIQSLRLEKGAYSEVYLSSMMGEGIVRNILDPFSLLLYSNKVEDNAPIDAKRARGMNVIDAIEELMSERGGRAV